MYIIQRSTIGTVGKAYMILKRKTENNFNLTSHYCLASQPMIREILGHNRLRS